MSIELTGTVVLIFPERRVPKWELRLEEARQPHAFAGERGGSRADCSKVQLMGWILEDIERDWITGSVSKLAAAPDSVVKAFDLTERILGRQWIEKSRVIMGNVVRGCSPTLRIVNMGQKLEVIEDVSGREKLLDRIRNGDISAEGELTAVYLLRSRNPLVAVELYPKVGEREADFRMKAPNDETWTYVEVTQLSQSEAEDRARQIMERIAATIKPIQVPFALEVFLRRIPSELEITAILAQVPEMCGRGGKERKELADSLGFLSLNQSEPGVVVAHDHPGEDNVPRIGLAKGIVGPGEPRRHLAVRMAFSDDRAKAMLDAEAAQLSKEAPGLIMVGVGQAPGAMKTWEPALRRRFQPQIHTRVSGVCLWLGGIFTTAKGAAQLFETSLILNPHARIPLPNWISETLAGIRDEFKKVTAPG
jgi:hypothetical protein